MPVARFSQTTWERLKRWAVPLEDSAEDALGKVLDMAEEHLKCTKAIQPSAKTLGPQKAQTPKITRLPQGQKVSEGAYRQPIIEALDELGGSGHISEVLNIVEQKMEHIFGEVDRLHLKSGADIRWRNTAQWTRFLLVQEGLLKSDSKRGIWELTESGIEVVKRGKR